MFRREAYKAAVIYDCLNQTFSAWQLCQAEKVEFLPVEDGYLCYR